MRGGSKFAYCLLLRADKTIQLVKNTFLKLLTDRFLSALAGQGAAGEAPAGVCIAGRQGDMV